MEKKELEKRRNYLMLNRRNGYDMLSPEDCEQMERACKDYLGFVTEAKTEREAVDWAVSAAKQAGFRPIDPAKAPAPGDRLYHVNRAKAVTLVVMGKHPLEDVRSMEYQPAQHRFFFSAAGQITPSSLSCFNSFQ